MGNLYYEARNAVGGNITTGRFGQIDVGAVYEIRKVVMTNRRDSLLLKCFSIAL